MDLLPVDAAFEARTRATVDQHFEELYAQGADGFTPTTQSASAPYLHRARNLIERFFDKIKAVSTSSNALPQLVANYLAFVQLVSDSAMAAR